VGSAHEDEWLAGICLRVVRNHTKEPALIASAALAAEARTHLRLEVAHGLARVVSVGLAGLFTAACILTLRGEAAGELERHAR